MTFEMTAVGNPLPTGRLGLISPILDWEVGLNFDSRHGGPLSRRG